MTHVMCEEKARQLNETSRNEFDKVFCSDIDLTDSTDNASKQIHNTQEMHSTACKLLSH
jgi:hypothetical protein